MTGDADEALGSVSGAAECAFIAHGLSDLGRELNQSLNHPVTEVCVGDNR